jgi:lysine 2,3-aminomutase
MVSSCEHLRTTLREAIELDKQLQGLTAGFNTPAIVCDLPGGGGKRKVNSYEHYDEILGISTWKAPSVKNGKFFYYFDPIHKLSNQAQNIWKDTNQREKILKSTNKYS